MERQIHRLEEDGRSKEMAAQFQITVKGRHLNEQKETIERQNRQIEANKTKIVELKTQLQHKTLWLSALQTNMRLQSLANDVGIEKTITPLDSARL